MNINALVMKELNINLVRRTLKQQQVATKHQIAAATGLSVVTVASIVQTLVEANEVFDDGQVASGGGRPAQCFRFNENHAHVLVLFTHEQDGLDVLHLCVANLNGVCIYEMNTPLADIHLHTFEPYIDAVLEEYATIRALGFGLPGVELNGRVVFMDYPALTDTDFLKHYETRYQLPVRIENDVNAASVGYCKQQPTETEAAMLYLYFPEKYPPGGGIYINGALYKGHSNYAGEISQMPLGINWSDPTLYTSVARFCEAITTLIAAISMLLNPQSVILYSPSLTEEHRQDIQHRCNARLPVHAIPQISLASDFTRDYQNGMIQQTLALLEPQISLSL